MEVYLILEWGPDWNATYNGNNQVNMGSSVNENAIGGLGKNFIYGSKDQTHLGPATATKMSCGTTAGILATPRMLLSP